MSLVLHRRVICLLLCLAIWRGPLPVWHEHEAPSDLHTLTPQLAAHLRTWHARPHHEQRDHADEKWHWHVFVPWQVPLFPDGEDDHHQPPSEDPLAKALVTRTTLEVRSWLDAGERSFDACGYQAQWMVVPSCDPLQCVCHACQLRGGYLTTFLIMRPLVAITGVSLC